MIFCSEDDYDSIDDFFDIYPGASAIAVVEGGWVAFYSVDEYQTWLSQR